jgi:hypothetical protein
MVDPVLEYRRFISPSAKGASFVQRPGRIIFGESAENDRSLYDV